MKKFFSLFLSLIILSCGDSEITPSEIIEPGKMQAVLWDLMVAGESADYFVNADTTLNRNDQHLERYGQVLNIHKVTKPVFVKSLRWYQARPDIFKPIVDSIHYQSIRLLNRGGVAPAP